MARVFGKLLPRPEGCNIPDEHITQPIIPYGCGPGLGCYNPCERGIPLDHVRTHARDTIRVSYDAVSTVIKLDDGSGEGYRYPMPCEDMAIHLRRKGQPCFCLIVRPVFSRWDGDMEIRWPPEFKHLPYGYYEGRITQDRGCEQTWYGGWLLFQKMPPGRNYVRDYKNLKRRPSESLESRCANPHDISGETPTPATGCDETCAGCDDD